MNPYLAIVLLLCGCAKEAPKDYSLGLYSESADEYRETNVMSLIISNTTGDTWTVGFPVKSGKTVTLVITNR